MATPLADVRRARFATDDLSPAERLPAFREIIIRTAAKCEMELIGDRFACDVDFCAVPGFSIARVTATSVRVTRPRAMVADGIEDLVLMMFSEGTATIAQRGREATVKGSGAVFFSCAEPLRLERTSSRYVGLTIPKPALAPLISNLDSALMSLVPSNIGVMQLLAGYLDLLNNNDAIATPELRRLIITHIYDLVALALGATRDAAEAAQGRGLRAARMRAIKSEIRADIGRPDLTVGALARQQGVSERYVRKLFESEDMSFSDFVLTHRLVRAHRMLTDSRFADRSITSITYDSGFGDLSYFNRCFRRRYNATPSDVRAAAQQA